MMKFLLISLAIAALSRDFANGTLFSKNRRAECLPSANTYVADIIFAGCYTDADVSARTLAAFEVETVAAGNDPQNCANICGVAGYTLAGVEFGSQCFCGFSIANSSILKPESDCTMACSGNASEVCGGSFLIDIYSISNPSNTLDPDALQGLPDCTRDPLCSNAICDSSLSLEERVAGLVNNMTLAEKTSNMEYTAPGVPRLGLPPYTWWNEALHGVAGSPGVAFTQGGNWSFATSFPEPILTAAAFDNDLVNKVATIIGTEARAFANNGKSGWDFWTPNMNAFKDPRWGRGLETPGEDPYHISQYIMSLISGLQGGIDPPTKQIIATCKHFAVYDVETGRSGDDYSPTPQELSEYYLSSFKTCARDAKVGAIMCSYNAVDGIPSCANRFLLQTMLREHWGWTEPYHWVTSDCAAITDIQDPHHYVATTLEAAAVALNAGTDLACESSTIYNNLTFAVTAGLTTEAIIDQSITRLYSSLVNVGYFGPTSAYSSLNWDNVNTPAAQQLAYQAAVEGMVLLKNDGTLPLPKSPSKVAVIGPWSTATVQMQGNYFGQPPFLISPLAGFQASWPNVTFFQGTQIDTTDTSNFTAALAGAADADFVIYCGGIDTTIEAEALDRINITWPGNQLDLINELAALEKPLVVVQFGGGQLDDSSLLSNPHVNSLLWAGYPGQAGGTALADILDGTRAVAGRLPVTQYPAHYIDDISIFNPGLRPNSTINPGRTYMWYPDAVLPFGYGLHYTEFSFKWEKVPAPTYDISSLVKDASTIIETTPFVTVTASMTNVGKVLSDYVGLLFISTKDAGPSPFPIKTLVSFDRLFNITTGSTRTLSLPLTLGSLSRAATNGSFLIYPGTYTITLDNEPSLSFTFTLRGDETLIESVPIPLTPAPPSVVHLGCFTDSKNRTLNGPLTTNLVSNTVQSCASTCHSAGYLYAGVESGRDCFCANSISASGTLTDASKCNAACSGDSDELCGGVSFIDIFEITPAVNTQSPVFTGGV